MKSKLPTPLLDVVAMLSSCGASQDIKSDRNELRAPAHPLMTIDLHTSAWLFTDNLYDGPVKHWMGKDPLFLGVAKVDGQTYRFMGMEELELFPLVKTSEQGRWTARYTIAKPAGGWQNADFNDAVWKEGEGAFGTMENESTAKTQQGKEYIWIRRKTDIKDNLQGKNVYLEYSHDDDAIIYVNGAEVADTGSSVKKYMLAKLPEEAVAALKQGENLTAVYCDNRVANGLINCGLLVEKDNTRNFTQTVMQKSVDVQVMQTNYEFTCEPVDLKLIFISPPFMDNFDLMARPVNYLTYEVASNDGKTHNVELYFEAGPRWAFGQPHQEAVTEGFTEDDLVYLKAGSHNQEILGKKGDDVRTDWGYFYLAADKENSTCTTGDGKTLRESSVDGRLTSSRTDGSDKLALVRLLGETKEAEGHLLLGYDDLYSAQYLSENPRLYWNRTGTETILSQFAKTDKEYDALMDKYAAFDTNLMREATEAGGRRHAELCALAYRQAIVAYKLVEALNKDLLLLSKENFSNGLIGTVDVTYPSSSSSLMYNPELVKGLMNHIFYYSESGERNKSFAAHDVGTHPLADDQTYGGDVPVEESGNILVLTTAVAAVEGNTDYAQKHWDVLITWTDYLAEHGLDPDTQLCTDNSAGHFAHNVNLSIKAILGVAPYGYLADKLGKKEAAKEYTWEAKEMAAERVKMADDGSHYRPTFDKPGTWSQKYNLVWDKLMNLQIFSETVAQKEITYYLGKQNQYGLPLDNRETYTKTDWIMWTAILASDKATFEKFIDPVYLFMNETTDRVSTSDWVFTDRPNQRSSQARSTVGGYYIKMLEKKLKK